jgi:hypothetical protein
VIQILASVGHHWKSVIGCWLLTCCVKFVKVMLHNQKCFSTGFQVRRSLVQHLHWYCSALKYCRVLSHSSVCCSSLDTSVIS